MRNDEIPTAASMSQSERALAHTLARERRRWQLSRLLAAVAWGLAIVAAAMAGAAWYLEAVRFALPVLAWLKPAALTLAGVTAVLALTRPWWRRLDDIAVARHLEALSDASGGAALLTSAAELSVNGAADASRAALRAQTSPALRDRLYAKAARAIEAGAHGEPDARRRRTRSWVAIAVITGVCALAFHASSPGHRYALKLLTLGVDDVHAHAPYRIDVEPGDIVALAGETRRVAARLVGFDSTVAALLHRPEGATSWQRVNMVKSSGTAADQPGDAGAEEWSGLLAHLRDSGEYYVMSDGVRSNRFKIAVTPLPRVARIDLHYDFPSYTGLPRKTITDGGEIRALKGTRVSLDIHTEGPAAGGSLLLEGDATSELEGNDTGLWTGQLEVTGDGRYRVQLRLPDGREIAGSPDLPIFALEDARPTVALLAPGRDTKVTSVEEIEIRTEAADDAALKRLELVLSVNGQDEQVVDLRQEQVESDVTASHLLELEVRELEPGDLIAYYVRASDRSARAPGADERTVQSDIFFMEVRPYEQRFRRASGGGGGGGGGGGQRQEILAAQQRALVIALFNLSRDRGRLDEEERAERREAILTAQGRIKVRAEAIVRRTAARSVINSHRGFQRMAEELPKAIAAMEQVEQSLRAAESPKALPPARLALAHLQRADAAFREVQVAMRNQQGGAGAQSAEDLNNLFKLEMDKFRSQYAHVQRGREQPGSQRQVDEILNRLKRLAERQTRELRRSGDADGGSDNQRALLAAVEALLRQLEVLSARRPDRRLADAADALRQAAKAMRNAESGGQTEQLSENRTAPQSARRTASAQQPGQNQRNQSSSGQSSSGQSSSGQSSSGQSQSGQSSGGQQADAQQDSGSSGGGTQRAGQPAAQEQAAKSNASGAGPAEDAERRAGATPGSSSGPEERDTAATGTENSVADGSGSRQAEESRSAPAGRDANQAERRGEARDGTRNEGPDTHASTEPEEPETPAERRQAARRAALTALRNAEQAMRNAARASVADAVELGREEIAAADVAQRDIEKPAAASDIARIVAGKSRQLQQLEQGRRSLEEVARAPSSGGAANAIKRVREALRALREARTSERIRYTRDKLREDPAANVRGMEPLITNALREARSKLDQAAELLEPSRRRTDSLRSRLADAVRRLSEAERVAEQARSMRSGRTGAGEDRSAEAAGRSGAPVRRPGQPSGDGQQSGAARSGASAGAESTRGGNRRYGGGIGYGGNVYAPDVIRGIRSTRSDINRMWQRLVDSGHTAADIQRLVDTLIGIESGNASALPLEAIRSAREQLQAMEAQEEDRGAPGERAAFPGIAAGSVGWQQLAERYSKRLSDTVKQ
ncbi:MAG: hypothetical protein AAF458_13135 [Pseudomonadota bacterium]